MAICVSATWYALTAHALVSSRLPASRHAAPAWACTLGLSNNAPTVPAVTATVDTQFFSLKICMSCFYHRPMHSKPARPNASATVQGPPSHGSGTGGVPLSASRSDAEKKGGSGAAAQGCYFRLIVVLTPWLTVLSSNQRAVTVLVCV